MAVTLTEPGAAKAAVLTDGPGMVHMSFPIEKTEDTAAVNPVDGTPDIEIWGKATDGTLDSDLQVVDPEASLRWIKTWYDTKANIRLGHDPKQPVGRGIDIDGHYVKALIADPKAKHLIRSKVLNDFSVGIMNPDVRKGDPRFRHLDPMGKAVNGVITDRPDGLTGLGEISVVDRGANFGSSFSLVKAAADGTPEWVGKMVGPDGVVTKDAKPATKSKIVSVDLPANMSLSIKPSDLARLQTLKQRLTVEQAATKAAAADVTKVAEPVPDDEDAVVAAIKAAEAGAYKRDIDTATRRRLAGEGRALPNLSYPIETHEDAMNAAGLAMSGHGNVSAAKRLIRRIARKEGWTDVLDRLKGGKKEKVATVKAAEPDVAKCGCDNGMMDGKPCPDCKKGKKAGKRMAKAAEPPVAKKKGKLRAVCPGCGAKQNPDHKHCPECGGQLPQRILMTTKNHDFVCLGCGKNLDKGEKHCPECGRDNPGYLPEADRKIPANEEVPKAAKAGKKAKGKGKKGKPFGGSQAPPFGKDKETSDDQAEGKKDKAAARVVKGAQSKGKKGKGGSRPTPGSASGAVAADEKPVPRHREPDGGAVEALEHDAHMEDGDSGSPDMPPLPLVGHSDKAADAEMTASLHLSALGVPADMGGLHALTCPAFAPADVAKAFPHASFAAIDAAAWQMADLEKAATGPLDQAAYFLGLGQAALALKSADPHLLNDLREAAHKAFRDANPGPASFPTPGELSPQRFNRPYLSEGRSAPSPGHDGPNQMHLPPKGGISAEQFQRGYLDAGRASEAPTAQHTPGPVEPPATTGAPTDSPAGRYVTNFAHDGAAHAMSAMHDHISRVFPDICPMHPGDNDFRHPVPAPVGGVKPAPGAGKTAKAERKAAQAAKRKAARAMAAKRRRLERKVIEGKISVNKARAKLGMKPRPEPAVTKAATAGEFVPGEVVTLTSTLEPDAIKTAIAEATAPLAAALARAEKDRKRQARELRKVRKTADAIAGQPDTSAAPYRGVALTKTSAPAVQAPNPAGAAEHAQLAQLRLLQNEAYGSPDPGARVAAMAELDRVLGIAPPMTTDAQQIPMRR